MINFLSMIFKIMVKFIWVVFLTYFMMKNHLSLKLFLILSIPFFPWVIFTFKTFLSLIFQVNEFFEEVI